MTPRKKQQLVFPERSVRLSVPKQELKCRARRKEHVSRMQCSTAIPERGLLYRIRMNHQGIERKQLALSDIGS